MSASTTSSSAPPVSANVGWPVSWLKKAWRDGFSAVYTLLPRFLREVTIAKRDGSYYEFLAALAKTNS
jgi:hypothetical protein